MPTARDLFTQVAAERSPAPSGDAMRDMFARVAHERSVSEGFTAPPKITAENHINHAAKAINALEAESGETLNALGKQAVVDSYRQHAGLDPLLGVDNYQAGLNQRNEDNPLLAYAAGARQSLAGWGTSALGIVDPKTAQRLQRDVEATTGEASGFAGGLGKFVGAAAPAAAALPAGALGMAGMFGLSGFGGSRVESAQQRLEHDRDISLGQEFGAAILSGLAEGGSGLVTGGLAKRLGGVLEAAGPGILSAVRRGGGTAATQYLKKVYRPILANAGVEGAEEAATELAQNAISKYMGINPDQALTAGVVQAGMFGAALSPFLGGVAGKIQAQKTAGRPSAQLAAASMKRTQAPPAEETLDQQVSRLEQELAEERKISRTDELTQVPNKRGFEELESQAYKEADETGESVAVIETDLANFKVLNDKLGHETGDRVLVAEAEAIQEAIREATPDRPGDISAGKVGRVGGDEFPVRLRNLDDPVLAHKVMTRANEIFEAKVSEIVGEDLPKEAYPFIAWGTEIRKFGDPRSSKELKVAADSKVIDTKNQMKKERGIPETRDQLTQLVADREAARAAELDAKQGVPEFDQDQVMGSMELTSEEDMSILRSALADEPYVLVDLPTTEVDTGFIDDGDINPDKLARSQKGIEAGTPAPPIVMAGDARGLSLLDGAHRTAAAIEAGKPTVPALIPRSAAESKGLVPTAQRDVVRSQHDTPAKGKLKPNEQVRGHARDYMMRKGMAKPRPLKYGKVNEKRAARIAEEYEKMEHAPGDPAVRESYDAMKRETVDQWEYLVEQDVVMEPWPADADTEQPYANSREMHADVRQNNHLWFFTGGDIPSDHPLAETTGIEINGVELTHNDVFRAVHDYFGHAKEGTGFGPRGEEAAWHEHSQMYSEKARGAMTSETRGQNSWVNFGPKGEANRADPANTEFAEQKAGLLPDWVSDTRDDAGPPGTVPPKTPAKPPKPPVRTTAAKKASMDRDRKALGLDDLPPAARKSWRQSLDTAVESGIPERAAGLASVVVKTPRPLTDVETAGIVRHAAELKNKHARLMEEIGRTDDDAELMSLSEEVLRAEQEFDLLSRALRVSGTEKGRALAAQKLTIDQNYDLVSVISRAKAAKGKPLTTKERTRFRQLLDELKALEKKLANLEAGVRPDPKEVTPTRRNKAIELLEQDVADMKKRVGKHIEMRKLQAELQKLQEKLDGLGRGEQPGVSKRINDARLSELRRQKKELLNQIRRHPQTRIRQLQDQIARLKRGEQPTKPLPQPTNPEIERLLFERDRLRRRVRQDIQALRPRSIFERTIANPFNAFRSIMTSFDFSAVFRQGGFIAFGHPIRAAKNLPKMFQAFWSPQADAKLNRDILNRPNAPLYDAAGLYIAPTENADVALAEREEAYQTSWAEKIPLVKNSQRAYVTFLNLLRADSFDAMAGGLAKNGRPTLEEATVIANFVNVATGRGKLGSAEPHAVALNQLFFAPRYVVSRFQLLAGQPFYGGNLRTRKMVAGEYARYLLGLGTFYTLVHMLDLFDGEDDIDVELNPVSSDFGKVRIGDTRLDPLSGLAQVTGVVAEAGSGTVKSSGGEVKALRGEGKAFSQSVYHNAMRFVRTKFSPLVGTVWDVLDGENVVGDPRGIGGPKAALDTGLDLVVPLAGREVVGSLQDHGVTKGSALGLMALFGFGLQTYQTSERSRKAGAKQQAIAALNQGDKDAAREIIDAFNMGREEEKPLTLHSLHQSIYRAKRRALVKQGTK